MTDLSGAARRLLEVTRRPASGEELSDAQAAVEAALWEAENPVPESVGFTSFTTGPESTSPQLANLPASDAVAVDPAPDPQVAASSDPSSEPQTDSSTETADPPAAA